MHKQIKREKGLKGGRGGKVLVGDNDGRRNNT